jgi:hypothetical protein
VAAVRQDRPGRAGADLICPELARSGMAAHA